MTIALYAADPVQILLLGIDQARALAMSNVTVHNDIDAFGRTESDLKTLRAYLRTDSKRSRPVTVRQT